MCLTLPYRMICGSDLPYRTTRLRWLDVSFNGMTYDIRLNCVTIGKHIDLYSFIPFLCHSYVLFFKVTI